MFTSTSTAEICTETSDQQPEPKGEPSPEETTATAPLTPRQEKARELDRTARLMATELIRVQARSPNETLDLVVFYDEQIGMADLTYSEASAEYRRLCKPNKERLKVALAAQGVTRSIFVVGRGHIRIAADVREQTAKLDAKYSKAHNIIRELRQETTEMMEEDGIPDETLADLGRRVGALVRSETAMQPLLRLTVGSRRRS